MLAGASQNQLSDVTGVNICFFGEDGRNTNDIPESHEPMNTSDYELPDIVETENKQKADLPKIQENMNLSLNSCSKKKKNESDVEILSTTDMSYDFKPLTIATKRKLCVIVKIPTKHISKPFNKNINKMGPPSSTKSITGDGNCLFRDISYALSNRQEVFGNVRNAIVDHLIRNEEMFRSFLQPRFKTVQEYIQTLRMEENNVWGTELEIIACADLLKTDIYTFYNGSWIKYSSSQICSKTEINAHAIFLQHQGGINHYEVVTAVNQNSNISSHSDQQSDDNCVESKVFFIKE
ncbi:unnamed protein product [Mytilus coruscus]|uniref:OTU domain-containing protein n=1 Tax=Mytilus coruscus TaxID=42192 RepID=A0A6J8C383_MYTCO|nr:unnamed protein product [Mytilus coruscus]